MTIRYAFGAIPVPPGWGEVVDIRLDAAAITLTEANGGSRPLILAV